MDEAVYIIKGWVPATVQKAMDISRFTFVKRCAFMAGTSEEHSDISIHACLCQSGTWIAWVA